MNDQNKAELRRLAEAATPGPWRECGADRGGCACGQVWSIASDCPVAVVWQGDEVVGEPGEGAEANASFIAKANPAAVLSLLDESDRLENDNRSKNGSMKAFGEQIAKLQRAVKNRDKLLAKSKEENEQLRAEVEALRKDAERYREALADVAAQIDGSIRETVRDCVNFIGDVQDIYGYCDQIDSIIDTAIDPDLAKEGDAIG